MKSKVGFEKVEINGCMFFHLNCHFSAFLFVGIGCIFEIG